MRTYVDRYYKHSLHVSNLENLAKDLYLRFQCNVEFSFSYWHNLIISMNVI